MKLFSEYIDKGNAISKIDARIKLIITSALLTMVLSGKGILFPLLIALICVFLCVRMRISTQVLLFRFLEPLFIAFVLLILKSLFSGGKTLFPIRILGLQIIVHKDGLMEGIEISSRIIGAVSLLILLGFTTAFTEFIAALSWFRMPRQFVELLMFTYRYLFVLLEDALVIYNAQKNRLGYSSMRKGLRSFGTLSGALVLRALEHSQKTALAMAQRGYAGDIPVLKQSPFKVGEIAMALSIIIIMGILWKIQ